MFRLARLICVSPGVALAVWLLPASVHIVGWTADGPVRVALLAPLWQLWVILGVAAIAVIVIGAIGIVIGAIGVRHRGQNDTVSDTGTGILPLALLWLWVIPYLPWIPDHAPVLLALAGPLRWAVLALALLGCSAAIWSGRMRGPTQGAVPTRRLPGRRTVFAVSLALYVFFGLWSANTVGPGADEPHYLVITQSLLRDHDLAIENNHTRGDYREYFGSELHPDFLRRGLNEVIYSVHAPGLPALLVPAYAAAGYTGAVVMLCLFGALAARAVFDLALLLAGPTAALTTWAAVCLTVPFVPHSWLIFPEIPGALVMAWAALWLWAPLPTTARTWIWRGLALAVLPWLHTKFVVLLAAMTAALLLRLWRTPRAAAALVVPTIVSVGLWIYSFHALYGSFDPQVPYGDFPTLFVRFGNIPRGLLGLLFDQKFGLLVYAPVYLIAIAGCSMMLRRKNLRLFALALAATAGAFVASSTRMYMWWGGSSAPARFLVPVLPLIAPMIAVACGRLPSAARSVFGLLLLVSLAVAGAGATSPQRSMLFSAPHGFANMVDAAQGAAPLTFLLPIFTEGGVRAPLVLLAPWAIAALFALAAVVLASRTKGRHPGLAAVSAALVTFVIGGAVLAGAPAPASQRRATALRGRLDLLHAYDGPSLRAYDYANGVTLDQQQLLALSAVSVSRADGGVTTDPRRLAGPFDLPPGRFVARFGFAGAGPRSGTALVVLGDRLPIARGDATGAAAALAFSLPVDAAVWMAVSDETIASATQTVDVVAESIVPRSARLDVDVHAIEAVAGRPGAAVIYADGDTYPEGGAFWTRSTRAGKVFVVPGGASTLILTLHVGPAGGTVRVTVDGVVQSVTLSTDQTRQIEIPIRPDASLVPVVVQAPGQFRPWDHEAASTDRRWLGCQVRIDLR